jgi:hypothetical protein
LESRRRLLGFNQNVPQKEIVNLVFDGENTSREIKIEEA